MEIYVGKYISIRKLLEITNLSRSQKIRLIRKNQLISYTNILLLNNLPKEINIKTIPFAGVSKRIKCLVINLTEAKTHTVRITKP